MSWELVHASNSRTQIGVQSALGTVAGTWIDLVLTGPANPLGALSQKMIVRRNESRLRRQVQAPVKGLKTGAPVELACEAKRILVRLDASATPQAYNDSGPLSHQILLRAGIGAELAQDGAAPQAGSATTGTPGTTSIPVTSSTGVRFAVGQIVIIGGYPRRVTARSTDTLTVYPALPTAPSSGVAVLNTYCYYPGEYDHLALSVRHAWVEEGSAETQQQALGVHGGVEVAFEVGDLVRYAYKGMALDWTEPGDLSMSLATTADDMGAPLVWDPVIYLSSSGSAPSLAQISKIKVTLPRNWQEVPGPGTQGVSAITEVASHDAPITVEISGHMGTAEWAAFVAGTARWMMAYTQDGSGSDQRTLGVYFPRLVFLEPPTTTVEGSLVFFSAKLQAQMATDITATPTPGSTSEISIAPMLFFLG